MSGLVMSAIIYNSGALAHTTAHLKDSDLGKRRSDLGFCSEISRS